MFVHRMTLILATLLVCAAPLAAQVTGAESQLNDNFVDPDLDVQAWVERFEGESREVFSERRAVLKATAVKAGDRVADIGAGTGLYTRLFAEAVGAKGWVHAVDISTAFLQHINRTNAELGLGNVTAVLGQSDSITLPPDSVDLAFVCDTYHHLEAVEPSGPRDRGAAGRDRL